MMQKCNNFIDHKVITETIVNLTMTAANGGKKLFGPKELAPDKNIVRC